MPTRPSQGAGDILADARKVIAAAKARLSDFKKADAGRKVKLLAPEFLKELESKLKAAESSVGIVDTGKAAVKAATNLEAKLRKDLGEALAKIRDDIALAYPDDKPLARAFGVGKRLITQSTADVLSAAEAVKAAYADKEQRAKAAAAGVSASAIAAMEKLRAKLADADTTQNTRISSRKSARVDKEDLLRSLKAGTARIRKVAGHVFRGQKNVLASFASTVTRRTTRPRTRPTTPPTTTPPPA